MLSFWDKSLLFIILGLIFGLQIVSFTKIMELTILTEKYEETLSTRL